MVLNRSPYLGVIEGFLDVHGHSSNAMTMLSSCIEVAINFIFMHLKMIPIYANRGNKIGPPKQLSNFIH